MRLLVLIDSHRALFWALRLLVLTDSLRVPTALAVEIHETRTQCRVLTNVQRTLVCRESRIATTASGRKGSGCRGRRPRYLGKGTGTGTSERSVSLL